MTNQLSDFYKENLGEEWFNILLPFLESDEMEKIRLFVRSQKDKGIRVYPLAKDMFKAFRLTPYSQVKVVIIGQDPYHTHGVADGLAFSSKKQGYIPPSLRNIYTEVSNCYYNGSITPHEINFGGNLEPWAKQGVLLLNTAFTVEEGKPASHAEIWEPFIEYVLARLNERFAVIYLLWGKHAQEVVSSINDSANTVLKAAHPSPFSAEKGFFNCKHFYTVNNYVYPPIKW